MIYNQKSILYCNKVINSYHPYIYTIQTVMENSQLQKISSNLQKSFLKLKTPKQVFNFLRDLLTQDEIIELSLRLDIAKRLHN
jgi:uncharacterized protein YerC